MKKLLLFLAFCCSVNLLSAQRAVPGLQDSHHNQIATLQYQQGPMFFDASHNFLCQFKSENQRYTIIDHNHKAVGYIVGEKEIQDLDFNTLAYLVPGTNYSTMVQDANHNVIGYVKSDGTVESTKSGVVGYAVNVEHFWAAAYFLVCKL